MNEILVSQMRSEFPSLDAPDLCQEAWLRVIRSRAFRTGSPPFVRSGNFIDVEHDPDLGPVAAYLYVTAHNCGLTALRRAKARVQREEDFLFLQPKEPPVSLNAHDPAIAEEKLDRLGITEEQIDAFLMLAAGFSATEVAEKTGIEERVLKNWRKRWVRLNAKQDAPLPREQANG